MRDQTSPSADRELDILEKVAEMLSPYTPDGARPRAEQIPGMLELLLRQREEGAAAGAVGPYTR